MSDFSSFESGEDAAPAPPGQLSSNGQWIAGSVFAVLLTVGFGFGLYAGTRKSAPEVAEKPQEAEKASPEPRRPEPEAKPEPKIEPKKPEPKVEPKVEPKDPKVEPKIEPKKPEPKPKEPEPKKVDVKPVAFKDVAPLFRSYCGNCHGFGTGKPKGDVDLRSVASISKYTGLAVPGNPAKSRLYASITEGSMPPDGKQPPNPDELKKIHDWILSGAKE